MAKLNIKKIIQIVSFILLSATVSAFNWPQQVVDYKSMESYFGQKRGNEISKSIIFNDPAEVSAIEDGDILVVMTADSDYTDFFPSTLGTSVILSHADSMLSVYGNLDTDSIIENLSNVKSLAKGEILASTGNTGWQTNRSNLEFQVLDRQIDSAVNPKLFMPRTENELNLKIENICLINKSGDHFYLNLHTTLNSGVYKVYQKRNPIASPYRTTVMINGVTVDQITYDKIKVENNSLYVMGKKKYTDSDVYPDNDLALLGEVTLTPGKSTLGIYVEDFQGDQRRENINITIF